MRSPGFEIARRNALASYRKAGWLEIEAFAREHAIELHRFFEAGLLEEMLATTTSYYDYMLTGVGKALMRFDAEWGVILVDPRKAEELLDMVES